MALDHRAAEARSIKADILTGLADRQVNAPVRNYYLVCAQELRRSSDS